MKTKIMLGCSVCAALVLSMSSFGEDKVPNAENKPVENPQTGVVDKNTCKTIHAELKADRKKLKADMGANAGEDTIKADKAAIAAEVAKLKAMDINQKDCRRCHRAVTKDEK